MSYSESKSQEFFYFSNKEREGIETFLKERGYKIDKNHVCGDCCGMYAECYYVNSVGGKWNSKKDSNDFGDMCKEKCISCSYSLDGYTISADPNEEDISIK